jgi:drug/metabolite transporter (DMT)-like permease
MDTIGKTLSAHQPVQQVVWGRYFFQLVWLLLLLPRVGLRGLFGTRRLGLQLTRGLLVAVATFCFFTALSQVPLADAYAISFAAPLLVTIFSIPLLGEQVGWRRWSAVLVGFAGVMIVIRPGFGAFHWALVLPLVTATCFALYQILTRMVGAYPGERSLVLLFYMAFTGSIVASLVVPFHWQPLSLESWLLLIVMGALAAVGHLILIKALTMAAASLLSPFIYTQMIWAILFGILVFGDLPDFWTLFGSAVIIGSGLFVIYRETARRWSAR